MRSYCNEFQRLLTTSEPSAACLARGVWKRMRSCPTLLEPVPRAVADAPWLYGKQPRRSVKTAVASELSRGRPYEPATASPGRSLGRSPSTISLRSLPTLPSDVETRYRTEVTDTAAKELRYNTMRRGRTLCK
jgi:hypothetical protein